MAEEILDGFDVLLAPLGRLSAGPEDVLLHFIHEHNVLAATLDIGSHNTTPILAVTLHTMLLRELEPNLAPHKAWLYTLVHVLYYECHVVYTVPYGTPRPSFAFEH